MRFPELLQSFCRPAFAEAGDTTIGRNVRISDDQVNVRILPVLPVLMKRRKPAGAPFRDAFGKTARGPTFGWDSTLVEERAEFCQ